MSDNPRENPESGGAEVDAEGVWLGEQARVVGGPADVPAEGERRDGGDRRRMPSLPSLPSLPTDEEWHSHYARFFRLKPLCTYVKNESALPVPAASFDDSQRKVEVLLSVHTSIRDAIQRWEDRIFQAFMISAGAVLSAVVFFVENRDDLRASPGLFAMAVGFFGLSAWMYLYMAARAHARNGIVVAKLEAALGLCQPDVYVRGDRFFGYSGIWEADWRTPVLLAMHFAIVLLSVVVVAIY